MNLHAIAGPIVGAVNPSVQITVKVSAGYTTQSDGTRVPSYTLYSNVSAQVQSLTFRDLQQIDGLNLQGTRRAIYLNGDIEGIVRASNRGGDLIVMPDGTVWLVAMVLESWGAPGSTDAWCKVVATLQDGS